MTFRTTGFIIGKKDFRDHDRMFTLLTAEHGKVQAMGQATRKLESKLSGKLELLHCVTVTIAKGKQIDRIVTVDLKESFEGIKENLEKLVVALHCFEILNHLVKWEQRDDVLYAFLQDFISTLAVVPSEKRITLAHLFMVKLGVILGHQGEGDFQTPAMPAKLSGSEFAELLHHPIATLQKTADRFLCNHIDVPLRSQEYFSFLAGK